MRRTVMSENVGQSGHPPDIWLSGLVAALEAMASSLPPSTQTVAAFRRRLTVPPVAIGAPETVAELPVAADLALPSRIFEPVH